MKSIPNSAEREQNLALTFPPHPDTVAEPLEYLQENGLPVSHFRYHVLSEPGWLPVIRYSVTYDPSATQTRKPTSFIAKWQTCGSSQLSELLCALWNAGFDGRQGLAIAEPLAYITSKHILLQRRANGVPLLDHLTRSPVAVHSAHTAGRWLGKFHSTASLPVFGTSVQTEIERIARCAQAAADSAPAYRSRILQLAAKTASVQHSADSPLVPTHGDFHPKNIFVSRHCLTVIDFDRFTFGHRERDLGFFIAQSMTMPRQPGKHFSRARKWNAAFLDGYTNETQSPDSALLHSYIVSALLEILFYKLCVRPAHDLAFIDGWLAYCKELTARTNLAFA